MSAQPTSRWADLGIRTASSLVLIPVVLLDVWYGGVWFELFAAFLGILIAHEWCVIAHPKSSSQFAFHALATMCAAFLPDEAGLRAALFWIGAITVMSILACALRGGEKSMWRYAGVPYAALPVLALVMLRNDGTLGLLAIVLLMLIVWAADICAYFAGRIIGGPKLAPVLSPKKTWAGLGGAIVGAMAIAFAFARGYGELSGAPEAQFAALPLMLLAAFLALIEQAGDIFESAFKRHYGVKDSGTLIPGHGGVMDRLDGLIFVAVLAGIIGILRAGPANPAQGLLVW